MHPVGCRCGFDWQADTWMLRMRQSSSRFMTAHEQEEEASELSVVLTVCDGPPLVGTG